MTPFFRSSAGFTLSGFLLVLLLVGGILALTARLAPVYLEHWAVEAVLEGLVEEPPAVDDARRLRLLILRRLSINEVHRVKAEHIEILPQKDHWRVTIRYATEIPLGDTWSLLARFTVPVEIPRVQS